MRQRRKTSLTTRDAACAVTPTDTNKETAHEGRVRCRNAAGTTRALTA